MSKVAIVTGGSSGIGLCAAHSLRDAGCTVYELSRRDFSDDGITHICTDITDDQSINDAVTRIVKAEGHIDILICNAGTGISGAVEFTSVDTAKQMIEVNFWGMVNTVMAALPVMRKTGGRIVCTSSVAGALSIPFQTYYSVSKAAINSFVSALNNEVRPFGVSVCAIMPGDIKTGFTAARKKISDGDDIYGGRIERSVSGMEHDEMNGMAPELIGRFFCKIALKKHVKPLYAVDKKYSFLVVLARLLPVTLVNRILFSMYAK